MEERGVGGCEENIINVCGIQTLLGKRRTYPAAL